MNLQQFLRILRARWLSIVVTLVVVIGATVTASLLLPFRYTATAAVVVESKGVDALSGGYVPLIPMPNYVATQIDIIQSRGVARMAVDLLKLAENPVAKNLYAQETGGRGNIRDWLAELLLKTLKVEPSRESSVVSVSFTGNDPKFAATVANAFVQAYMNTTQQLKVQPARQTSEFFAEQIKSLKDAVETSQARLSAYQRSKGIIAADERLDVENARLNDLSTQLVTSQAQTFDAQTRQRQVAESVARGEIADSVPDVVSNPVIQGLKGNIAGLEAKVNDISSKVGKNHPQYIAARAELQAVRNKLKDEMNTLAKTIGNNASISKQREDQIKASLDAQRAKVLEMKRVRDDLTVLLREVESAQKSYDAALARMTQTRLEGQASQSNVAVIAEAVEPAEPSSPKLVLNTVIAAVLGLLIGIALALVREMIDGRVRFAEQIETALALPVLGVLGPTPRWWRRGISARPVRALPSAT